MNTSVLYLIDLERVRKLFVNFTNKNSSVPTLHKLFQSPINISIKEKTNQKIESWDVN
jgi:hypothetical protein